MLGEFLNILLLTVLFTLSTAFALLLRKGVRGGAGQFMYVIWLAVMLAALIPVQIAPPTVSFIVSERTVAEVQPPYRDRNPEIMLITDASSTPVETELPEIRARLYESGEPIVSDTGKAVAFNLSAVMLAGFRFILFVWAVGASYSIVRELLEYREIKRYLWEYSDPCTDPKTLAVYDACCRKLGLRHKPKLRRICEVCPTTPCVIGFFRSTVYLSAFCDDLDSSHLEHIFTHELCHVKRRDMLYKLLMVLTTSVHWFNPMSRLLRDAVTEDCEMACDATVLHYTKAPDVRDYMESVLTVAERLRRERKEKRGQYEPLFRAAFFMANDTTPNYLKRRYLHMKTTREKKNTVKFRTICACALACIAVSNVILLSSCSYIEAKDMTAGQGIGESYVYDPVEIALANYFCVPAFSDITEEQYAQIESLDVYLVTPQDGTPDAVYVSVNGGNVELLLPCITTLDEYESIILPKIDALDEQSTDESFAGNKFRAFFCIKDPTDPALEPRAVAEMQALFPITKTTAVALYDPYTTVREDAHLYSYFYEAELVNEAAFSENALHAKLQSLPLSDGVQLTVSVAESTADFEIDADLFKNRSEQYTDYMSAYMETIRQVDQATLAEQELNTQTDINGNGIIGE